MSFCIGEKKVGGNAPTFIIAEAGVNHVGCFSEAEEMVAVAHKSKADAVTFQHIKWDEINSTHMKKLCRDVTWDQWRLSDEQMLQLFQQGKGLGLAVTACVVSPRALEFIVEAGADFIKIVSGDLTCYPFLKECASTGLPIFLSTGNAVMEEIEGAIEAIEKAGGKKVVVYQTNSMYPTPPSEVNLKSMEELRKFGYPVGFCDHTEGSAISLAGCALGAKVIEKHFSLNPQWVRPDHEVSLNPEELCQFVKDIRKIENALGQSVKKRSAFGDDYRIVRRSIVSSRNLNKGARLQREDLAFKRPGTGLEPYKVDEILGKELVCDIKKDIQITLDMLVM